MKHRHEPINQDLAVRLYRRLLAVLFNEYEEKTNAAVLTEALRLLFADVLAGTYKGTVKLFPHLLQKPEWAKERYIDAYLAMLREAFLIAMKEDI